MRMPGAPVFEKQLHRIALGLKALIGKGCRSPNAVSLKMIIFDDHYIILIGLASGIDLLLVMNRFAERIVDVFDGEKRLHRFCNETAR